MKTQEEVTIEIPDDYILITGSDARAFKDKFVRDVVSQKMVSGTSRARELARADSYIIKMEIDGGRLRYRVAIGLDRGEESFIAIGPNLARRLLSSAMPFMKMDRADPAMASAGAFDPVPAG